MQRKSKLAVGSVVLSLFFFGWWHSVAYSRVPKVYQTCYPAHTQDAIDLFADNTGASCTPVLVVLRGGWLCRPTQGSICDWVDWGPRDWIPGYCGNPPTSCCKKIKSDKQPYDFVARCRKGPLWQQQADCYCVLDSRLSLALPPIKVVDCQ